MSKAVKGLISILISIAIIIGSCISINAIEAFVDAQLPVVVISGDSVAIFDKDGNLGFSTSRIGEMVNKIRGEDEPMLDAVLRLFVTFLKHYYVGCITGNFTKYYDFIYEAFKPIFGASLLDCNGEPSNGSKLDPEYKSRVERSRHTDFKNYNSSQYCFYYDWRLDPLETADELNAYIKDVKAATGYDKIGVICRCLGANVFLAYVAKYGMDDIKGVGFDGIVANGSEMLSEPISGKFKFDAYSINRLLIDLDAFGKANLDPAIPAAVDTASKSGLIGLLKFIIKFPNYK